MVLQWHAFHALLVLFTVQVSCDEVPLYPTSYLGLEGDTNLGHSGYVHLSTNGTNPPFKLSSCQNLNVNESTCHFGHTPQKTEYDYTVMRAWAAVTIRDNILALLGYLLHRPNQDEFPEETYSSLKIIYDQVRRNNIRSMDILQRIQYMVKLPQVTQTIDLFKVLPGVMPLYCTSPLEVIVRTFSRQKPILKSILFPGTNEKGVDIFTDIGHQFVHYLSPRSPYRPYDKAVSAEMGKEFAIFFAAIQESKIVLTQPVVAVLLLHMRFPELSPEDTEDLRFLADVLRENKIPDWSPSVSGAATLKSPYDLVEMILQSLTNHSEIDPPVNSIIQRLQILLQSAIKIHRSKLMDPFFSKSELNMTLLLTTVEEEAKIPEVKTFKQMINDRNLSLSYALKGFVRYFYPTPRDLVLAFMRRIQTRVPMNNETATIVTKIVSALHEPVQGSSAEVCGNERNETKIKRSIRLMDPCGFWTSDEPTGWTSEYPDRKCMYEKKCFSQVLEKLQNSNQMANRPAETPCPDELPEASLSGWLEGLKTPAVNPNLTHLLENVSTILTIFIKDPEISALIDNIVHTKSPNITSTTSHESINHFRHADTILQISTNLRANTTDGDNSTLPTLPETKKDLLARILKDMLSIKKVRARRFVYYEVTRVYCILIHGTVEYNSTVFLDPTHLNDPPLENITEIFSGNVSGRLKEIIQAWTSNANGSISLEDYRTNRQYLSDLLRRLLLLEAVRNDDELFNEIVHLLRPIQDLPIEFPTMGIPYASPLMEYLGQPGIFQMLGEGFDLGRYMTRGRLLRAILEKSLTISSVRDNEPLSKAIKNRISRTSCTGLDGEPVREILEGITTDQPNVYKIIQYGLDRQKFTTDVQEAYANMWNWYGGSFEPLSTVKQMNISLYDTRASFLSGFLDKVQGKVEGDFVGISADIKLMRSAVLKTGTGAEPVDYL